jgi:hypothetical protein
MPRTAGKRTPFPFPLDAAAFLKSQAVYVELRLIANAKWNLSWFRNQMRAQAEEIERLTRAAQGR